MSDPASFIPFYDQIPVGVVVIAQDNLEILYSNPSARATFGINDSPNLHVSALLNDKSSDELLISLHSKKPPASAIILRGRIWLRLSIHSTLWAERASYIFWVTDITHEHSQENELRQALRQADDIAEMKANFLATMSHEMRTPMQSVYGLLELIALEKPAPQIMEMVNTAKNSASSLLEILDDILDLAKMDADKMELDMFEVPVRTLARGVLEALAVKAHGRDIKLSDDIAKDVPFVIVGDPKRLRQIMINLTGNALKFTEKGEVKIRVTTLVKNISLPADNMGLRIEIIDTGIGMNEKVASRLFQAFTQADSSTARKFGGTGLGLSISKKLVELMGGEIGVISKEGEGSTFWFEIPTKEVSISSSSVNMPDLSGISVLSVEDHPQGAKEIVSSLRSMGANIESCATYSEAVDLVRRRPFDVAVVDQGLPDGLGIDLIRDMMDLRPFMGIIMYTVRDDPGLLHSLQSMGIRFLGKPASRIGLGEAIAEASIKATRIETSGPTRLLIAEDTASVRDLLRRQLETLGAEADFVTNGKEALETLSTGKYGILFTDLHMPELDGYGLVSNIREQEKLTGRHLPIIVLTADVQMAQRQVYLDHGFDECLLKPVSLGHFRRLLVRWGLLKDDASQKTSNQEILQPSSASIDMQAIVEQMGSFDDSAREMLGFFVDMTKPVLERLQRGQRDKKPYEVQEAAHSLKGAARSACAQKLGDLAAQAQDSAERNADTEKLVAEIIMEFAKVEEEIKRLTAMPQT